MKPVVEKLRLLPRKPSISLSSTSAAIQQFLICTAAAGSSSSALTVEEVEQINAVIPRLCSSSHLKEAISLISTALFTENPPLNSLPLSVLINRLALEPDLTHPMHFLNVLKYNPRTDNPLLLVPVAKMFVSSFFQKGQPMKALKIFHWVSRPDFPGRVVKDLEFYSVLVEGFCKNGMVLDALRVLRVMASENLVIGDEVRVCVYRSLLREARVREALDLNTALDGCSRADYDGAFVAKVVVDLLDRMIENWVE